MTLGELNKIERKYEKARQEYRREQIKNTIEWYINHPEVLVCKLLFIGGLLLCPICKAWSANTDWSGAVYVLFVISLLGILCGRKTYARLEKWAEER